MNNAWMNYGEKTHVIETKYYAAINIYNHRRFQIPLFKYHFARFQMGISSNGLEWCTPVFGFIES